MSRFLLVQDLTLKSIDLSLSQGSLTLNNVQLNIIVSIPQLPHP